MSDGRPRSADAIVTKAELLAMPSLLTGDATNLTFVASPGAVVPSIRTSAGGVLEDGRRFQVTLLYDVLAASYDNFNLKFVGRTPQLN